MVAVLCDECVDVGVAEGLRSAGYDATTVLEQRLLGASDDQILERAASQGRIVFTYNSHDFPETAKRWTVEGREFPGLLVGARAPAGILLRRLDAWLKEDSNGPAIRNTWGWLPRVNG